MRLGEEDFKRILGCDGELPESCTREISRRDYEYQPLTDSERDDAILRVLKALSSDLESAGRHRLRKWEDGWAESLKEFIESGYDTSRLVPKFVRKNEIARVHGSYVMPTSSTFETDLVTVLRTYLFTRYFGSADSVYEFGCGTGHNLVDLAELYPSKRLFGYDWSTASGRILSLLREMKGYDIHGGKFDLFLPDPNLQVEEGAGVFTIGTLEQVGGNFMPFLEWLLARPFSICINVETIYELYDQDSLFDYLPAKYLEKRNYLRGYLPALQDLERSGRIEITNVQKTFGSFFHDGYTFVVWRKIGSK